jgi:hypothetical protein
MLGIAPNLGLASASFAAARADFLQVLFNFVFHLAEILRTNDLPCQYPRSPALYGGNLASGSSSISSQYTVPPRAPMYLALISRSHPRPEARWRDPRINMTISPNFILSFHFET